jgi:hypothetical protein
MIAMHKFLGVDTQQGIKCIVVCHLANKQIGSYRSVLLKYLLTNPINCSLLMGFSM